MLKESKLVLRKEGTTYHPPQIPARPDDLKIVAPHMASKRGKGGSLSSRIAMIHSFAHIESWAIDLSWDILLRFHKGYEDIELPLDFFSDWLKVAWDEARHFSMWSKRLKELDTYYGALGVHNALWQSAEDTNDTLINRLAVIHMVHEARGLDVTPKSIARLQSGGDKKSGNLLREIYEDEITHVQAGVKWFRYLCKALNKDPISTFHRIVKERFHGPLKPPFNTKARTQAGFTEEWYMPLVRNKYQCPKHTSKKESKSNTKEAVSIIN
ncbi:hypothetical protein AAMO2058_001518400 [Amorphochlora amoebiformis]